MQACRALILVLAGVASHSGLVLAEDVSPPQLVHFGLSSDSIDTSAGTAPLTVQFTVTDDASGAAYIEVVFLDPFGTPAQRVSSSLKPGQRVSGVVSATFPRFSSAGNWSIGSVFLADEAGNSTTLDAAQLQGAGFSTDLVVKSASDTTPPRLTALAFSSKQFDTTAGPGKLSVSFSATDDIAGPSAIELIFQSPSGAITQSGSARLEPRTNLSGSVAVTFPRFSEAGVWALQSVLLTDAAGNAQQLDTNDLVSSGFPSSVTLTAATDVTPPSLVRLTFSPDSIDAGAADAEITLNFAVTDDISGVTTLEAAFSDPGGTATQNASVTLPGNTSVNGTAAIKIPKGSPAGDWDLTTLFLADAAGNTTVLTGEQLASRGFRTRLLVTSGGAHQVP